MTIPQDHTLKKAVYFLKDAKLKLEQTTNLKILKLRRILAKLWLRIQEMPKVQPRQ